MFIINILILHLHLHNLLQINLDIHFISLFCFHVFRNCLPTVFCLSICQPLESSPLGIQIMRVKVIFTSKIWSPVTSTKVIPSYAIKQISLQTCKLRAAPILIICVTQSIISDVGISILDLQDHMTLEEFSRTQIEMWWMERPYKRGTRLRKKCTGKRLSHLCHTCYYNWKRSIFSYKRKFKPYLHLVDSVWCLTAAYSQCD